MVVTNEYTAKAVAVTKDQEPIKASVPQRLGPIEELSVGLRY